MNDAELARIAIDSSWLKDRRGRIILDGATSGRPAPHLVVNTAAEGLVWAIGDQVPDRLADDLRVAVTSTDTPRKLDERPPALSRCVSLLEATFGVVDVAQGPNYVISSPVYLSSGVEIRTSDAPAAELRAMNPPDANWLPDEWAALIDGRLGPWAMALRDGRIVSICHSALHSRSRPCRRLDRRTSPTSRLCRRGHRCLDAASSANRPPPVLQHVIRQHLLTERRSETQSPLVRGAWRVSSQERA